MCWIIDAQVGKLASPALRCDPAWRPHRLHLRAESGTLPTSSELMPTCAAAPDRARPWPADGYRLRRRNLDGTVQIDDLLVAGGHWKLARALGT